MYMILFVLNDSKQADRVLDEWQSIGINGVTIFESTGAYRRRQRIPGRFAFTTTNSDETNITFMSIVNDEETVKKCLEATEKTIGDLSQPNTGIFSYWPLTDCRGFQKYYPSEQ